MVALAGAAASAVVRRPTASAAQLTAARFTPGYCRHMPDDVDTDISDLDITDEELAELAMAADPNASVDGDAVPFHSMQAEGVPLLPEWYMPAAPSRSRSDWRAAVAVAIAVGLVLINAFAICVTNGFPEIP